MWILCAMRSLLVGFSLVALATGAAAAGPPIAVLAFGGEDGDAIRESLAGALQKRYAVIHGQKILDACDTLGITMSKGPNLAQAAQHVGVVAVVGGTIKAGHLVVAVYSAKTGLSLTTGMVPFNGGRPNLGKALTLILKGLKKAPKTIAKRLPAGGGAKAAGGGGGAGGSGGGGGAGGTGGAGGGGSGGAGGGGSGGGSGGGGGSLTFEPDAVTRSPGVGARAGAGASAGAGAGAGGTLASDPDENPLARSGGGGGGGSPTPAPAVVKQPPTAERAGPPRIEAELGLGTWIRSFGMNDPAPGQVSPKYDGAAFTLRLGLVLRPIGFFSDGFARNIFARLRFQQALGLQSRSKQDNPADPTKKIEKIFGTTLRELSFDFGYNWKIFSSDLSPWVDLGLGYGMTDFGINWEGAATTDMPGTAYRYLLIDAAFRYPFTSWIGAHFAFDYRVVFSSGEVENDAAWYGPSSTGGINFGLGLTGKWRGFTATAEYCYTRYFFAFKDPDVRMKTLTKKVAGGALDVLHALTVSVGYTY